MEWGSEHSTGGGPQWTVDRKGRARNKSLLAVGPQGHAQGPQSYQRWTHMASVFLPLLCVGSWGPAQHAKTACCPGEAVGPYIPSRTCRIPSLCGGPQLGQAPPV